MTTLKPTAAIPPNEQVVRTEDLVFGGDPAERARCPVTNRRHECGSGAQITKPRAAGLSPRQKQRSARQRSKPRPRARPRGSGSGSGAEACTDAAADQHFCPRANFRFQRRMTRRSEMVALSGDELTEMRMKVQSGELAAGRDRSLLRRRSPQRLRP